jgi:D-beta-D-heptose 7-phosphate kinase/D-beta-D-heptose 1-phosphate adenosyltransferase
VVVVGDPGLDEYVYGTAAAVAKEAPVVALEAGRRVFAPGQAANVAANAAALGARVELVGLVGADEYGAQLAEVLEGGGVDVRGLVSEARRPTTYKVKYVASEAQRHDQHVFHVYWEDRRPPDRGAARRLREAAGAALGRARAVVLSDYDNGTLTPGLVRRLVAEAARKGVVTVANARGGLKKFRGVTAVVANREELERAAGGGTARREEIATAMARAARRLETRYLIITAGSEGMYGWPFRGGVRYLPPAAREVVDATGAGDTVTAAVAAGLAAGLGFSLVLDVANAAAAAVVAREGTSVAAPRDLRRYVKRR